MNRGYNEATAFPKKIASSTNIAFLTPLGVIGAKHIHGIVYVGSSVGTMSMYLYCADWVGFKTFRAAANTPLYIPGFAITADLWIYSDFAASAVVFYS